MNLDEGIKKEMIMLHITKKMGLREVEGKKKIHVANPQNFRIKVMLLLFPHIRSEIWLHYDVHR